MSLVNNNVVAIYARLSREDEKDYLSRDTKSRSIENQIKSLRKFVEDNNMVLYDTYIDDGCSGRNFNRENFKKMMQDMEKKRFNCIIVKDLSRFGRNYILMGKYIDEVLPLNNIRFISLSDRYDSAFAKEDDMSIVIKNFLNDLYLRECRKKARLSVNRIAKNGYIVNRIPYGYTKDKNKKVIVDEEAASVVRKIFQLKKEGKKLSEIEKVLESEKILCPNHYKYLKTKKTFGPLNDKPYYWGDSTVRSILANYEYCGHAVNLSTKYLVGKKRGKREDCIIVRNTHPAIISEEEFDSVQDKTVKIPRKSYEHLRLRNVICSKCNKEMNGIIKFSKRGDYKVYKCSCCGSKIKLEDLHNIAYEEVINLIKEISKDKEKAKEMIKSKLDLEPIYNLKVLNTEKENIQRQIKKAFEQKVMGEYSEEKYKQVVLTLNRKLLEIEEKIDLENKKMINNKTFEFKFDEFVSNIEKIKEDRLDTIRLFVDSIYINDNKISIKYKYEY